MNYSVGVSVEDGLKEQAILEAREALEGIAQKYQCKFELKQINETVGVNGKTVIAEVMESKKSAGKNSGLSFGGEIEL